MSRFGQEEIALEAIPMCGLLLEEAKALQIYALHTLSDLLPNMIMYDPFSPRAHAVDLMHRRSTFGERFKNAFRSRSSSSSSSQVLRPVSASSDSSLVFGKLLEEVSYEEFVE